MAKQVINIGTAANSNNGDPLRTAFTKINENFTELYSLTGAGDIDDLVAPLFLHTDHVNVTVTRNDANNRIVLNVDNVDPGDLVGSVFADDSTLLVDGVSGSINLDGTVKGDIIPDTDIAYDLGSATNRFRDLYLSGNTIDLGGVSISSAPDGSLILPGTTIAVWEPTSIAYYTEPDEFFHPNGVPISGSFGSDVPVIIDQVTYYLCRPENASERTGATPASYQPVLDGNGVITSINIITPGAYPTVGDLWQDLNTDNMWALPPGVDIGDWDDIYAAVDNIEINGNDPYGGINTGVLSSIVGSRTAPNPISGQQSIDGTLTVNGSGQLIETISSNGATATGGLAYSYNGVSIGVTANPVGDYNTEQSTVQVSSGEITLTSTAQQNGDPQYTSTGEVRITPTNFRISLLPNTSWQGELTFDENEFRIPSDNIVGEGATLRLNNMSDISIPNERGSSTFNLSIVNHPQYDYSISAINGNVISVTHFGGYPDPQVDWVMYDPNSNSTTAHPVIDVVAGAPGVWDVTLADDGYDYSQLNELILWDLDQQTSPHQVSINSDGDLTGVTSINNVNVITGVSELRGNAVDQWSYIISPTDNGTITNMAFGYFGEGGAQNILNGSTSIENLNIGPLGTGPDAPLIKTTVSQENALAIDLDISSGTSGDVSGHVTIGTGDVSTKGEIFLNAPVNVEGGTVRIDTTGSLLPATRITKEFIEFQGASQLSMPYDYGISKLSIDIATAEALSLTVALETVNGGETTWSGVSPDIDPFFDLSTAIGWVYTDVNGVNHVITGASDVDQDTLWDVVFATNPDLTTEYGPGAWGGIRIWNPENVDPNTRSVQIDYDGVLTGISEIVDLQRINTSYLNYDGSIQIGSASSGAAIQLAHSKLQIFAVPPTTSKGAAGDFLGQVAFDANYIYYCTTAYTDGVADIWKRVAWSSDTW